MPHLLSLESFEEMPDGDTAASAEYDRGYQDGLAAGDAGARAEGAVLDDAFVQALADIDFTYAEARRQILLSLGPLFNTVVDRILPHCVDHGFAGQLAHFLGDAATADTAAPITLHLHPDTMDMVRNRLATLDLQVNLKRDPSLSPHAAWVQRGSGETCVDTDALLAEITDALGAILDPEARTVSHG